MRPVLHVIAKALSLGVTFIYIADSSITLILLTMYVVTTIQNVAGMQQDSLERVLLCVTAGGIAIYAFVTEAMKNTRKFDAYTEKMHRHIAEV
ncbi:hypothetical protein [Desulfovibrio cuneatus]|uniref:hypothetical protein n=1 Tax=Desulfovibrio cuneatus TaxID=159728 RepID=UPI000487900C|nr:hypothetical protein [Desulfovibrio cuneatus]